MGALLRCCSLAVLQKWAISEEDQRRKPVNKVLKLTVLSVIVLLVVLGAAFCFFSGHILKAGVETAVTKALGVGAHIDEAALSIIKGTVKIKGLTVNNPAGYTYKNLLELGDGRIAVKVGSLLGNTVHIKEIKLDRSEEHTSELQSR